MNSINNRGEKVPAVPIPEDKYEQFKYRLEELSGKYAERNMMLFFLGVATGYRTQDIVRLTVGEIKEALEEDRFLIQEQKQYKAWLKHIRENPGSTRKAPKKREVPIKSRLRKLLREFIKGKSKSQYAFPSNKGSSHISAKSFSNILAEVGKSLGIKNISGHSMRKTYATRYWIAKRDLEGLRRALGHKSIETTKNYLGLDEKVFDSAASIADDKL
ncbi:MAG: tyrosine-type recombinase/integrase [Clostridium baratii]|uniref:tyrosine-type recombinase/integrase n=1 Tax=Clostridium perfringens TaxID=1502 RepID=UPI001C865918|nr:MULTISPECIES: tyrosine-type recombinase/integrase [Clostridium]MBS6041990.1 tyrosine-type recombinase/integrase [Clostridium baratii]MDU7726967.1 tyrosine-type recombinase/integrase [Clostridium perfringens]